MKFIKLLSIILLLSALSCSSSDDANDATVDSRYKFVLTDDGNITFIGDQTNTVIKRILNFTIESKIGYFFNESSRDLTMITRGDTGFYDYQISKVNIRDVFNTIENSTNYELESTPITLDFEEIIVTAMFQSENRFSLITKIYPDDNFRLRTYVDGNLTETVSFYELINNLPISFDSFSYCQDVNQLVFKHYDNSGEYITRFDAGSWNQLGNTINFNRSIFGAFGHNSEGFLIARGNSTEYFYTIEGALLGETSETFDYLGRASIGYDTVDNRYEYIQRSDGRNETGVINTSNGEIERSGVSGEIGFNESPLFFFNL